MSSSWWSSLVRVGVSQLFTPLPEKSVRFGGLCFIVGFGFGFLFPFFFFLNIGF